MLPSNSREALDNPLLSLRQFAEFCGLSESTVRRLIKANAIAHYQPGGPGTVIRIPRDALKMAAGDGVPAPESIPCPPPRPTKARWRKNLTR